MLSRAERLCLTPKKLTLSPWGSTILWHKICAKCTTSIKYEYKEGEIFLDFFENINISDHFLLSHTHILHHFDHCYANSDDDSVISRADLE